MDLWLLYAGDDADGSLLCVKGACEYDVSASPAMITYATAIM